MRDNEAQSNSKKQRKGMPLALVISRYFLYILIITGFLTLVIVSVFSMLISNGMIYQANYAEQHVAETSDLLRSGEMATAEIPTCYRWAVFDEQGDIIESDLTKDIMVVVTEENYDPASFFESNSIRASESILLPEGGLCVLFYDYLPDFISRDLRDSLPDPQTLLGTIFVILFIVSIVAIAMRAARVISRKMQPLAEAAANIERQDLDFTVGSTNVREMNEVLSAMERMRSSLDESLKARWTADEAQRRQVTALAHDLKTPLAVARWNTDLLSESQLDEEQSACAKDLEESIARMDNYLQLLTEISQKGTESMSFSVVDIPGLSEEVKQQAMQLCKASNLQLDFSCECEGSLQGNRTQLTRAIMNLVANAVDHAPSGSTVTVRFAEDEEILKVIVEDEGSGFTPATLEHGKDRFYTGAEDRNSEKGHYGLGLSIANDIATAHHGTLTLENKETSGARCTLELHLG